MNNPTIVNALNGVAINAATNGDTGAVAALEEAAQILASIVPTNRAGTLAANAYDAIAASTTSFLVFAGLTVGAGGKVSPQLDSMQKTATQSGISVPNLGG